jgi:hypothetical protein
MQSSSTTTSITVSLVGAGAISVQSGIYVSSCNDPMTPLPQPPHNSHFGFPFLDNHGCQHRYVTSSCL